MRPSLIALVLAATLLVPQAVPVAVESTFNQLRGDGGGRYTARQIAEGYLARIEAIDRSGPTLRSVIETNPEALNIADALDLERREKGSRGPLHGIAMLIKDNIDTADRMMTTAGSLALEGPAPSRDAFVVERLRRGGRGHPRQDEPQRVGELPIDEVHERLERARRARPEPVHALDRNACGSSSGTGAAISANLAAAGIGTETDGSIVCPSSVAGSSA